MTSILAGADIASLFDHEDLERISLDLKRDAILQGVSDTKEAIFRFFLERVKQKLHLVLSTTPAGSSFRRRCRLYPPLINCCTIDWFDKWPLDALRSVAVSFLELSELGKNPESNEALLESVSKVFVEVFNSVEQETQKFYEELRRRYYTTPTSYMEFVRLYLSKLNDKRAELSFNRDRLCTGLQKLSESNELVGTMQTELLQLGPKLENKAKVCNLPRFSILFVCLFVLFVSMRALKCVGSILLRPFLPVCLYVCMFFLCLCLSFSVCPSFILFLFCSFYLFQALTSLPFHSHLSVFHSTFLLSFSLFRRMRLLSISSLSTISLYLPTRSFDFFDPSNMRTRVTFSEPSKFFTRRKNIFLYFVSWCH